MSNVVTDVYVPAVPLADHDDPADRARARRRRRGTDRGSSAEAQLARYRATGDRRLRNQVVEDHGGLAVTIARDFSGGAEPIDDLVQVAYVALVKAAERFDPSFGVPYRNFAAVTIRGELRRHLRDACWAVRVPRRLQELRYEVRAATDVLRERLSRAPTATEVAEYLHTDLDEIVDCLCADSNFRSLSLFRESGGLLGDEGVVDAGYGTVEDRDAFTQAMEHLPERLRVIVEMRFVRQMKQSAIAEEIGVSQVQISRLLRTAIVRLRQLMDTEHAHGPTEGPDEARRGRPHDPSASTAGRNGHQDGSSDPAELSRRTA